MPPPRRDLIAVLSAAALSALAACSNEPRTTASPTGRPMATKAPAQVSLPAPARDERVPIPASAIERLPPSPIARVALTVDDGIRPDVIDGYAHLCRETGLRMTFFANGCYASWRQVSPRLRPLVESGQVVVANHTLDHPNLTLLSDAAIARQLQRNDRALRSIYGHSTGPFFRPPYGAVNARVRRVAREAGYPATVLWNGTLGDDQNIPSATVMRNARAWLAPGRVVIGHANHPGVLKCFDAISELLAARRLKTVTVADVWKA